jgi:hypothetical protein
MLALFADATADAAGWALVAQVVVGGFLAVATGYFAMRTKNAQVENDAKFARLEVKAENCEEDRDELKRDRDRMVAQIDTLIGRVKAVEKAPPVKPFVAPPDADSGDHPPLD